LGRGFIGNANLAYCHPRSGVTDRLCKVPDQMLSDGIGQDGHFLNIYQRGPYELLDRVCTAVSWVEGRNIAKLDLALPAFTRHDQALLMLFQ
jgi:hypothetical protein